MSVSFLDGQNLPLFAEEPLFALDSDAIECVWRPGAFFAEWLQHPGLAGAATLADVLDEEVRAILARTCEEPEFRDERLAHHAGVVGEIGHMIAPTPHLIAVQARFLECETVARLIEGRNHWRLRALLTAAAIEYRMPILGRSKFYQRLAETHSIPGGVVDPRSGQWLVLPS